MNSSEKFFSDEVIRPLTNAFGNAIDMGFNTTFIFLANDSAAYIEYSLDGQTVHGRLKAGERREMDRRMLRRIFLRGQAGGEQYRLEAY